MKQLFFACILIVFAACAGENKTTETDTTADSAQATELVNATENDHEFDYPIDSNYGAVLVMPNTTIQPATYEQLKSSQVWALLKDEQGYYIDRVSVMAELVHEEEINDEYVQVFTRHEDSCIFFISGVDLGEKHRVDAIDIANKSLGVGRTLELAFQGKKQKLVANGTFRDGKESDNFNDMSNYRLLLFAEKENTEIMDMLVAHDSFDDTGIELIFVGDIDADGLPDYLIETSRKYSYSAPALYLSKSADAGHLLKLIDVATNIGC